MKVFRYFLPIILFSLIFCSTINSVKASPPEEKDGKQPQPVVESSLPLKLSGFAQLQFSSKNTEIDTFFVNRARLSLAGSPVSWLRFKIQVDLVKSPVLRDALAELIVNEHLNFRLGQFLVPFSSENTTSAGDLLTINRSQTVDLLAPGRDNSAAGRDQGVVLFGRFSFFEYNIGILNGSGINHKDDNERKDISGRFLFRAASGLKLGFSIYQGKKPSPGIPADVVRNKQGLEVSFTHGRLLLNTEYIRARDDRLNKHGWYLLMAYHAIPDKFQLLTRFESINLDTSMPGQKASVYTAGANWFITPKSKLQVNYEYHARKSERDIHAFLFQLQMGF